MDVVCQRHPHYQALMRQQGLSRADFKSLSDLALLGALALVISAPVYLFCGRPFVAVCAAATLTVVEPTANGIGSDAFALTWDGELQGLNASGRSPAGLARDAFGTATEMPRLGWNAVTVPGCVSAWVEMSRQYGKLPFADLFEPAIEYAERGYMVTPTIARLWANQVPELKSQPGFAAAFMPRGRAPLPEPVLRSGPAPGPVVPGDQDVPEGAISRANRSSAWRLLWLAVMRPEARQPA
jgi:hypothetical protein